MSNFIYKSLQSFESELYNNVKEVQNVNILHRSRSWRQKQKNRNFGTCQFETATCKMDQQKVDEDKHL